MPAAQPCRVLPSTDGVLEADRDAVGRRVRHVRVADRQVRAAQVGAVPAVLADDPVAAVGDREAVVGVVVTEVDDAGVARVGHARAAHGPAVGAPGQVDADRAAAREQPVDRAATDDDVVRRRPRRREEARVHVVHVQVVEGDVVAVAADSDRRVARAPARDLQVLEAHERVALQHDAGGAAAAAARVEQRAAAAVRGDDDRRRRRAGAAQLQHLAVARAGLEQHLVARLERRAADLAERAPCRGRGGAGRRVAPRGVDVVRRRRGGRGREEREHRGAEHRASGQAPQRASAPCSRLEAISWTASSRVTLPAASSCIASS